MISNEALLRRARAAEPVELPGLPPALRAAREIRGFPRRVLAEASGVPERLIYAFEAGTRAPTRAQLDAIWNALVAADDQRRGGREVTTR